MSKHKSKRINPPKHKSKTKFLDDRKIANYYDDSLRDPTLKFSFRFLDFTDPLFQIDHCESGWFKQLLERKKNYCTMHPIKIKMGGDSTRCHPIDWSETKKPSGFNIKGFSEDVEAHQLTISQSHGRIVGFFTEDVFNVVWLDPDHNLYQR